MTDQADLLIVGAPVYTGYPGSAASAASPGSRKAKQRL